MTFVQTPEEKGKAFLERFLTQTDQQNAEERKQLIASLHEYFEDQNSFIFPAGEIRCDVLRKMISKAENSSPGPDGIKYSDLGGPLVRHLPLRGTRDEYPLSGKLKCVAPPL